MDFFEIESENDYNSFLNGINERGIVSIAVDIECEFNMHHYGEHLALVQIFDGFDCYIMDPLKKGVIVFIKSLFENKNLLKIMYSCSSDLSLLSNVCGIKTRCFLDLQIAVDLLSFDKKGLGSILCEVLNVEENNKSKFQKMDWLKRPLSSSAIEYALGDVFFLLELRDELFSRLLKVNLLDDFFHKNLILLYPNKNKKKLEKHEKAKGYRKLSKDSKRRFKELYYIRDKYAKISDKPPHYVFSNGTLLELAKNKDLSRKKVEKAIMFSVKDRAKFLEELFGVE